MPTPPPRCRSSSSTSELCCQAGALSRGHLYRRGAPRLLADKHRRHGDDTACARRDGCARRAAAGVAADGAERGQAPGRSGVTTDLREVYASPDLDLKAADRLNR